jgi:hypothetical protein
MGNSDLSNSENILVKVDQNNLIYIDPNSVVDSDGNIQPRGLKQENLVMYVNLEADLVPRTQLISDSQGSTLTSIARGNLNFLKNQSGDGNFDTSWTDSFLGKPELNTANDLKTKITDDFYLNDPTGQSFGMDSINIIVKGANFTPQVTINFVDIRGKVLFESAENSPYRAFFHIPWPIFYLTVKGYYGKAIRYRLHMVKFSSRFNESNGNFEVSTTFVGSTYAYLNDIPLSAIINTPYMFLTEKVENKRFNEENGRYQKNISRGSRGYAILSSIYSQYKQKGLVPKDMPVRTLKELGYIAESLDKILEKQIFNNVVKVEVFSGIKDIEKSITNFETAVKSWAKINLSKEYKSKVKTINPLVQNDVTTEFWYYLLGTNKTTLEKITNKDKNGTLEKLIVGGAEQITKSLTYTNGFMNKTTADFKKVSLKSVKTVKDYYEVDETGKVTVGVDNLINDIYEIRRSFEEQRKKLEDEVEKKMNEIIKDPSKGFGFEPTVRNIFAVLLANAEVYIRLMKDVHNKAFDSGNARAQLLQGLTDEQKKSTPPIYPWPEVKKPTSAKKQNVIAYPGDPELVSKLKSNDKNLWPEVDFIEEYIKIVTNRLDTNVQNEPTVSDIEYIFETDADESKIDDISGLDVMNEQLPYRDTVFSSFIYELYERVKYITLFDSYTNNFLNILIEEEYENIAESIDEDIDLVQLVKKLKTKDDLIRFSTSKPLKDSNGTPLLDSKGNPRTATEFDGYLPSASPYERFPYLKDNLPTVPYLKEIIEYPFKLEKYAEVNKTAKSFKKDELNVELIKYEPEPYRKNIYPFNSDLYLDYLDVDSFTDDNFKFNGILSINPNQGFVCSPVNSQSWVKQGFTTNMFLNTIVVGNNSVNILNTPYFHKQLYSDFNNNGLYGKYRGSAYLLLNSLPFLDLEDTITFDGKSILMSSLFREISSTHFLPYHLILKWGSIYHRYKKMIVDGVDILDGFINSSNITQPITGDTFFTGNLTGNTFTAFTINSTAVTHTTNVGINPYYQALYHQIINGYNHYNVFSGDTSYSAETISNKIIHKKETKNNDYWSVFVDNSKYIPSDKYYTLLPSNGFNSSDLVSKNNETFGFAEQYNFRVFWKDESITSEFSGRTFASHSEYPRNYVSGSTTDNVFSVNTNYRKVIDLIGTFSPKILESFEDMFLDFATEKGNGEIPYQTFQNINYPKFQDLLKDVSTVLKEDSDTIGDSLLSTLKTRQNKKTEVITSNILSGDNLIKFTLANPKEIDPYIFYGMGLPTPINEYTELPFSVSDINAANQNFIKLYIGEDINGHYLNFFSINDIKLSEENIIRYRPMAQIYAGYIKNGGTNTSTAFREYLRTSIFQGTTNNIHAAGADVRMNYFLNQLLSKLSSENGVSLKTTNGQINLYSGYNTDQTKLEVYNTFKSFNDKWTAGNSIGQRLLLEEFLFLDKANRDIGDKFYLNIDKILPLLNPKNAKQNLYGAISMLIQDTGLDMRALPAYINFYGTNLRTKAKIAPSKTVANNLFGTFLEVDYQESSPKIIIQLVGASSKRPDLSDSKEYKFADDSFYIGSVNNNPLVITSLESFSTNDLSRSNKVVAFEVSFGDQNQGIFKGVELDQSTLKNTSESFVVLENLGRTESGAGAYNVDVGLFDYYKQASYKCTVSCMGNVMIQPTMYFYLKNIPMFKGSYWITEVSHSIKSNTISTTFSGTRIPYTSLPDPKDSFLASYRVLFDKMTSKAKSILKQRESVTGTTKPVEYDGVTYSTDMGSVSIQGEEITKSTPKVGVTEFGVRYNGYDNDPSIQKIDYNGNETWLRAVVVKMGGEKYPIESGTTMNIAEGVKWSDVVNSDMRFYNVKFKLGTANEPKIRTATTQFKNPKNGKTLTLSPNYQLDESVGPIVVQGPISVGPRISGYGMGMSPKLMSDLGIHEGEVIYFKMS